MIGRFRRHPIFLRLLPVLFVAACASLGSGGGDEELLEVVEVAARTAPAGDEVWPGYGILDPGFIVFVAGDRALLVAAEAPPAPWTPVATERPALRGRLYRREGGLPGLTGGIDTDYPVGEARYTAIELGSTLQESLNTLYHEAFHAWQHGHFAPFIQEIVRAEAVTPEQVAGADLERRILAAAVAADGAASDSLIAAFVAARSARYGALTDSAIAVERSMERKEGTAHLVGFQGAAAALGIDSQRLRNGIIATLEMDLSQHGSSPLTQFRWRAYGTGSAMGLLLDRLGVDWREQVAAGAPLDSLLHAASRVAPGGALYGAARDRFDHDELLRDAERGYVPPVDDPIAAFLDAAPYRLVLEIAIAGETYGFGMSVDPGQGGFVSPEEGVTLIPDPERASMSSPEFELSANGRPLMLDARTERVIRLTVVLPRPPEIDGAAPADRDGPLSGSLLIAGAGADVTVTGDRILSIDAEADAVTIRLRAQ